MAHAARHLIERLAGDLGTVRGRLRLWLRMQILVLEFVLGLGLRLGLGLGLGSGLGVATSLGSLRENAEPCAS